uniref:Tick transposon n=1 Tax=Hymenolepis diminuta TaxID=6216 RepID=A0A0R3SNN9_HYMDI
LRLAADVINEPPHAPHALDHPYFLTQTREALYDAHEVARRRLGLAHKHQKDYYDRTAHGLPYQAGDLVMYKTMPPLSANSKFYRPWEGPFIITTILNDATCRIRRVGKNRDEGFIAHFNRLKPCIANQPACTEELEYAITPTVDNEIEITTHAKDSATSKRGVV